MEETKLISLYSKFYKTNEVINFEKFPWWSLSWIDIIQIAIESRLDAIF